MTVKAQNIKENIVITSQKYICTMALYCENGEYKREKDKLTKIKFVH